MTDTPILITPTFTVAQAIATKHALEDRTTALEAKLADLPGMAESIGDVLRNNLTALLSLLVAMGYSPEKMPRRAVAARLKELDA